MFQNGLWMTPIIDCLEYVLVSFSPNKKQKTADGPDPALRTDR